MLTWGLLAVMGCGGAPERPSVLLITLDTTRADHLATWGYPRQTTPTLDRLARRSIVFDDAQAPMATTLPSHLTMLTGTWPLEHGVLSNIDHGGRRFVPSPDLRSLAELFEDAGYATAAFVSAPPVRAGTGVEAGFQTFDEPRLKVRRGDRTTDKALPWLRDHRDEPFFAWIHYFDPHGPFDPEAPHDVAFVGDDTVDAWLSERRFADRASRPGGQELVTRPAVDAYDGELRAVDASIAKLQRRGRRQGWWPRTIVVVVGDHGEGLGQHGVAGHGVVWREQLHVPLFIHVPWGRARRIDAPVSLVDLGPTLLSLVDLPGEEAWLSQTSGRDALRAGASPRLGLSSLRQAGFRDETDVSLELAGYRWVHTGGRDHLFALEHDPHELTDVCDVLTVHCAVFPELASTLQAEQAARGEALGAGGTEAVSAEEIEVLRALGYLDE